MRAPGPCRLRFLFASVGIHLALGLLFLLPRPEPASPRKTTEPVFEVELSAPAARNPGERPARPVVSRLRAPRQALPQTWSGRSRRPALTPPSPVSSPRSGAKLGLSMRGLELGLVRDPAPAPATSVDAPSEPEGVAIKRRLDRLLAKDRARMNVQLGNVSPVLYDIQRDAEQALAPTWTLAASDPHGLGSVASTSRFLLRSLAGKYMEMLKRFGDAFRQAPGDRQHEPSFADVLNETTHDTGFADRGVELACTLCVELGAGAAPRVQVRHGSGRGDFDRLARRAVLGAARIRQPHMARQTRACYRVSVRLLRLPPLPVIYGSFDEVLGKLEVYYPLKKLIRTRVALVSAL